VRHDDLRGSLQLPRQTGFPGARIAVMVGLSGPPPMIFAADITSEGEEDLHEGLSLGRSYPVQCLFANSMLSAALFQGQADPGIGDPGSPARVEGNMILSGPQDLSPPNPPPRVAMILTFPTLWAFAVNMMLTTPPRYGGKNLEKRACGPIRRGIIRV